MSVSLFAVSSVVTMASPNVTAYIAMRFVICMVGAGMFMSTFVFGEETGLVSVIEYFSLVSTYLLHTMSFPHFDDDF